MRETGPCLCGDPECSRCGNGPRERRCTVCHEYQCEDEIACKLCALFIDYDAHIYDLRESYANGWTLTTKEEKRVRAHCIMLGREMPVLFSGNDVPSLWGHDEPMDSLGRPYPW